jgi:hypothetical protein
MTSEFTIECIAYGCSSVLRTLSSVQSGHCTPRPGVASNGAEAIHSMGTAKNKVIAQIRT